MIDLEGGPYGQNVFPGCGSGTEYLVSDTLGVTFLSLSSVWRNEDLLEMWTRVSNVRISVMNLSAAMFMRKKMP